MYRRIKLGYALLVLIVFIAMPMRVYLPSSFVLEMVMLIMLLFPAGSSRTFGKNKSDIAHVIFLFCLLGVGIVIGDHTSALFHEHLRYCTFFLFLLLLKRAKWDYTFLMQCCIFCCVLSSFFIIYELIHLNILTFGDFYGVKIIGKAIEANNWDDSSDYFKHQWFLGIPYFRPFGLLMQPQKTGFVPVLGIIMLYFYDKKKIKHIAIHLLFFATLILSAAKTAIAISFLLYAVIIFDIYPGKRIKMGDMLKVFFLALPLIFYLVASLFDDSHHEEASSIITDFASFFNLPIYHWLIGVGIPNESYLNAHGYIIECFHARVLAQMGLPLYIVEIFWLWKLIRTNDKKSNCLIAIAFIGMGIHYCVINAYFIILAFSILICYAQNANNSKKYHQMDIKTDV